MDVPTRNPLSLHAICGVLAAGAFALSALAMPAHAAMVLEEDLINCTGGGANNGNPGHNSNGGGQGNGPCAGYDNNRNAHDSDVYAAEQNSLLPQFPKGVDLIGKWDGGFESGDARFTDDAITLTLDSGTWNWELTEKADIWDIVKIGIKQSNISAYFLLDPSADSGSFNMVDLFNDNAGSSGALADWFNGNPSNAFSHVSFFGTNTDVPEPGVIALLGLGLAGFAVARRRRRTI